MNCYNCHAKVPAQDCVIVVAHDAALKFCEYACAGRWAIKNRYDLQHIAYFAAFSDIARVKK